MGQGPGRGPGPTGGPPMASRRWCRGGPGSGPRALLVLVVLLMAPGPGAATHKKLIRIDGDIILGGIFPMHEHEHKTGGCGAVKEEKGVQRLEAMLYALDAINADSTILPNVSLGAVILDSCSYAPYALEQSMEFVRNFMNPVRLPGGTVPSSPSPDRLQRQSGGRQLFPVICFAP
ncbi:metabotropic glutamate receptor 4-like [Frankliniella occidentalis]|uniref:Metabotropic glutamate receptor 4-like n=1 Tax=Frankliniella occidentalis TaxID=133901 RepID=A0A9C6XCP8_FRAOC|nr:metabotropic glutamate receptor 4-like [Frankliniella occidentalis]